MRKHYGLLDQPSADLGPDANYFLMLQTDVGSFLLFFFCLPVFLPGLEFHRTFLPI